MNKNLARSFGIFLLLMGLLFYAKSTNAQAYEPFVLTDKPGVYALDFMPSLIVDADTEWDVNIVAVQMDILTNGNNSFGPVKQVWSAMTSTNMLDLLNYDFTKSYLEARLSLPAVAYQINERNAVAFQASMRSTTIQRVSSIPILGMMKAIFSGSSYTQSMSNEFIGAYTNNWLELGVSYAHEFDLGENWRLQAGTSVKYLGGIASGQFELQNVEGNFTNTQVEAFNASILIAFDQNMDAAMRRKPQEFDLFNQNGYSFDLSVSANYKNKLKMGVSALDLGRIIYHNSDESVRVSVNDEDFSLDRISNARSISDLGYILADMFIETENPGETSTVKMMPRFMMFASYDVSDNYGFYASTFVDHPQVKLIKEQSDKFWTFQFTPYFKSNNWGIVLPMNYNELTNFQTGIGLRWKMLTIGSDNIISHVWAEDKLKYLDLYFGMRLQLGKEK